MGFFSFLEKWAENAAKENEKQRQVAAYEFEKPQLLRIISESIELIENTKNLKTALGRFDLVRNNYGRLLARDPSGSVLQISVGKWIVSREVATHTEIMQCMEMAKKDYIRDFFKEKIDTELLKAKCLSDKKLKKAQLKKALKSALDGLAHLPKDVELKELLARIEGQITSI